MLFEKAGADSRLNHLGVEVADVDIVDSEQTRLAASGLASVDERGTTCCYAKQDKFWVEGAPNGELWEVYTVLADTEMSAGELRSAGPSGAACCASRPDLADQTSGSACC